MKIVVKKKIKLSIILDMQTEYTIQQMALYIHCMYTKYIEHTGIIGVLRRLDGQQIFMQSALNINMIYILNTKR